MVVLRLNDSFDKRGDEVIARSILNYIERQYLVLMQSPIPLSDGFIGYIADDLQELVDKGEISLDLIVLNPDRVSCDEIQEKLPNILDRLVGGKYLKKNFGKDNSTYQPSNNLWE